MIDGHGNENQIFVHSTPSPWLARFFSLGKIHMKQIHMNRVISDQNKGNKHELNN